MKVNKKFGLIAAIAATVLMMVLVTAVHYMRPGPRVVQPGENLMDVVAAGDKDGKTRLRKAIDFAESEGMMIYITPIGGESFKTRNYEMARVAARDSRNFNVDPRIYPGDIIDVRGSRYVPHRPEGPIFTASYR